MSQNYPVASSSYLQSALNTALGTYVKKEKCNLLTHPITAQVQSCDSPTAILSVLQESVQQSNHRRSNWRLTNPLDPIVNVLHGFSSTTTGQGVSLVLPPVSLVFSGIGILLSAAKDGPSSKDSDVLLDIFVRIEIFFNQLKLYTKASPTAAMTNVIVKIIIEILDILVIATKEIKQGRSKKLVRKLLRQNDIKDALYRLDTLATEARLAFTDTLSATHNIYELQDEVRRWLSPPDTWVNHKDARDAHHRGTATWFTQRDDFSSWKSEGSLLWIHGLPGSGKTVLCSSIIEHIKAICRTGLANVVFFYFDYRNIGKQDVLGLLSSIIIQFCWQSDEFSQILSSLYSIHDNGSRKPSEATLMECLKDILKCRRQCKTYIVLDALDECPNVSEFPTPRTKVLAIIEELIKLRLPHVHFCITSRLQLDIRNVFKALAVQEVALHEQAGQNQDIFSYIEHIVSSDPAMRRWEEEDRRLVVKALMERGGGSFRWIDCQYENLRRCLPQSIRRTLDEFPETLYETYERALLGIDRGYWDYAHRLFQFLIISKRPPRVEELTELFSIQSDAETVFTFDACWRPEDPEEVILSVCSNLVIVANNDGKRIVQFSHFSVREFLTSNRIANSDHVSHFWVDPPSAHTLLARACLSILLHLDDRINRSNIQNFPLALYAAQYWVDHARFANAWSDIQPAIERLFDRNKPHFAAWLWLNDIDNPSAFPMTPVYAARPYPALYYAALYGLRSVAEVPVDAHPQDLNARIGMRGTALHVAVDGGHQSVVMLLLERGADLGCLDSQGRTPLHIACRGCTDIVSVLIDRGVDLNAIDNSRETPLHVASQCGRDDIIRLLLNHGAETDRVDDGGWTALHVASHEGHDRIVQLLIDHGADASLPDNGGWTPLHLASWEGQENIVRLLLDRGINGNHPDNNGWTALHAASQQGHKYCVELLLSHGADPDYANSDGSTSLHLASQRGQDNTVKSLLHHGADANRLNGDGWTSLHLTSQRGNEDVVRLLLDHHTDPDCEHSSGSTPLHLASQEGHDHIVQLLLDRGAYASSLNNDGWTPLYLASQKGHIHIVRLLLEWGT